MQLSPLPFALPLLWLAAPLGAEGLLSRDQLIRYASEHSLCGELAVLDARRRSDGMIALSCGPATGFVPAIGALALSGGVVAAAAGLALAAGSGGGGGTTPSTTAE